jgi:hypothetical protein
VPSAPPTAPQIPDYELLRHVGQGAYGDVWLARGVTGIYRAIKVVWRSRFVDDEPYEREFSGLCDHARVSIKERRQLALLHVGRNDAEGFFYYAMELADDIETGPVINPDRYEPLTLKHYRDNARQLSVRQIVSLAVELTRALASLHAHGLVHRDIKPSNIIVVEGQPKLADIGLVTPAKNARTLVGTEGFMPPEGPGTLSADVYSLGKVLYEIAMGRDREDYPRLAEDLHERPDRQDLMELNEVIVRACEPLPTARYPDAEALLKDLLLLQSGRSVRRLRLAERGLAQARRAAILLTIVASVGLGGAWIERQRAEQEAKGRRTAEAERDQLARLTLYSAGLARAQRALETGDYGRARELLRELIPADESTEDPRGFEWRALWHEAQGDPAEVIRDSGPAVDRVFFSPDGRWFAVHDASKTVTVYEAATLRAAIKVPSVHRLAGFSDDGLWLLGTTPAYLLQAWNVLNGSPLGEPQGEGCFNHPISTVPGGGAQLLVLTSGNGPFQLRIWDFIKRAESTSWAGTNQPPPLWEFRVADTWFDGSICSILTHHDRARLATFQLLSINIAGPAAPIEWAYPASTKAMSIASHAEAIAAVLPEGPADRLPATPLLRQLPGASEIGALAFSHDRYALAVGSKQGSLHLFDVQGRRLLHLLHGHSGAIMSIAWAPDGSAFISSDNAGHIRRWRFPLPAQETTVELSPAGPSGGRSVYFSPEGNLFAARTGNARFSIYDATDVQHRGDCEDVELPLGFSDGNQFLSFGANGFIQQCGIEQRSDFPTSISWLGKATDWKIVDAAGSTFAGISEKNELLIGQVTAAHAAARHDLGEARPQHLTISPDGARVALVLEGLKLQVWHSSGGASEFSGSVTRPVEGLSFSFDGRRLAVCMNNGDVAIIDLTRGQTERLLRVSSGATSAAFSPEGGRLVCSGPNGLLHVYRTTDWREISTLAEGRFSEGDGISVNRIEFSPDGRVLAICHRHGKLRIWRAP